MAKRVITNVVFEDDLTGEEVPEDQIQTVEFAVDGVTYEIDLSPTNREKFAKDMEIYIQSARKTGKTRKGRATTAANKVTDVDAKTIREWAANLGIDIPARGRIPQEVRQQYEQAHAA